MAEKNVAVETASKYVNRLEKKYKEEIRPALVKEFNYSTVMMAPRLEKIVINMGVGDATQNSKALEDAVADLATITGQRPIITKAKKSIATFKVREGQAIGCKVTLRGVRMYEFLDVRLHRASPRPRLPRHQPQFLRRTRQLHRRRQGTIDLPRDRLR